MSIRKWVRQLKKAHETWSIVSDQLGWKNSFLQGRPVDGSGQPIPWYTYPAIEFLRSLDLASSRVFEYGCGNSSIFWASRAKEVFAVENDVQWANTVRALAVPHLTILEATDKRPYVDAPLAVGGEFDIVIVDGRHRRACAAVACRIVSERGMIIFDNADWYPDACADIRALGWFQIDFSGLGPINPYAWTTAAFVKSPVQFPHNGAISPTGGNAAGAA